VLLVDDHDGFRGYLRDLLSQEADMAVVGEATGNRPSGWPASSRPTSS
jgi:DNA-binding NarL/FixJ family response regulator